MAKQTYQISLNGTAVDEDFYGAVALLSVEENVATANSLQLRLNVTQQADGTWRYVEDERLALFNSVTVWVGFSGGDWEPVFEGYITDARLNLGSEPGNATLDLSALDASVLLSLEEKMARWVDLTDSEIVTQIVSNYGFAIEAEPTAAVHQERDTTLMQRGSDVQFIRTLAQRNGLEFFFETDKDSETVKAYLRAPQLEGTPQPDLAIRFGAESNLRSFAVRVSGQRPLRVKTTQIEAKTASVKTAEVDELKLPKLGAEELSDLLTEPLDRLVKSSQAQAQMLVLGPPSGNVAEMQSIAQAVRDEAGWFITATGEINSTAYQHVLRAHRTVLVKGAGASFSGKYYVTRVVHELKSDGSYSQRFEARRNARGLGGSEQFGDNGKGLSLPGM